MEFPDRGESNALAPLPPTDTLAQASFTPARPIGVTRPTPRPKPPRRHGDAQAVIGDALRIPMLWCDLSPCIGRFTRPDALGERDLRRRAFAAGWRYDALGRFACPSCVQHNPGFWPTRAPVPVSRGRLPARPDGTWHPSSVP
jgi:hypothetical protein